MGALALVALVLLGACATGGLPGGRLASRDSPAPEDATAWGKGDEGEAVFALLPTDFAPVRVGDAEFTTALVMLMLDMPLRVGSSILVAPSRGGWAPGFGGSCGEALQSELMRSYGLLCERRGTPGDCLTLLEDGPHLRADDKRSPEPVSKGVAAAFSLLMWGYLGWEFFDLLRAYAQLHEDAPRATTFAELREVGERFGRVIGPNSVRILVLVGTAAIGETAALLSKAPKLPGFGQASRTVEATTGLRLREVATGAERVIVSVPEGTLRVVLPRDVVAMAARGSGRSSMTGGRLLPNGHRAWRSHSGITRALGSPGKGKRWHHIIEQHKGNIERFGPEAIHNTENVIAVEEGIHIEINRIYSSKSDATGGRVVREWLRTQSYEQQRAFGLQILRRLGVIP